MIVVLWKDTYPVPAKDRHATQEDLRPSRAFLSSYVPKVYGLPSSPVPPVTLILDFR